MEEQKTQRVLVSLVTVLVVFGIVLFGYSAYSKDGRFSFEKYKKEKIQEENNQPVKNVGNLAMAHFYSDGEHTYLGHIETPTPCYNLSSQVFVEQSKPEQVTMSFVTVNTAEACIQIISQQVFTFAFSADEEIVVSAILNNKLLNLKITEVSSLEALQSFRP